MAPTSTRRRSIVIAALALAGCAALPGTDPLRVDVVDIDAAEGRGLELRLAVTLRLQNPNDMAVEYDGAALELELNGRTFATGVSDRRGSVPRYGEALLTIPVSVSAFNAVRQALVLAEDGRRDALPYVLRGKLSGGLFGTVRFTKEGELRIAALGAR